MSPGLPTPSCGSAQSHQLDRRKDASSKLPLRSRANYVHRVTEVIADTQVRFLVVDRTSLDRFLYRRQSWDVGREAPMSPFGDADWNIHGATLTFTPWGDRQHERRDCE